MKVVLLELPFNSLLGLPIPFGLGTGYIASTLEQVGHSVSIINGEALKVESLKQTISRPIRRLGFFLTTSVNQSALIQQVMADPRHHVWDSMIRQIDKESTDVIGISLITAKMSGAKLICQRIKEDLGNIPIVLGGVHPTSLPVDTLNQIPEADYVVVGEGEETVKELVQYLGAPTKHALRSIKGLAHRDKAGKPVINELREFNQDLDSLPFPKRDTSENGSNRREDMIITCRGCPYRCKFCADHVIWKRRVRYRSIDNVIEEIAMLRNRFGTKRIRIVDPTFTLSKERVIEFSQKVRENRLDSIEYSIGSRVDTIDGEMLTALKACGVKEVRFGVESGSPRILQEIGKDTTPEQVSQAIALTNAEGITTTTFYMIGHPGETKQDIEQSKELLCRSKATYNGINMVTIYPETDYAKIATLKNIPTPSISNYYKEFQYWASAANLTELTDKELQREYRSFARLAARYNFRGGLLIFWRQPLRILNRLFGR